MPLERSLACGWEGGVNGSRTLTTDLLLWSRQHGQGRTAATLTAVWEMLLAASLSAKWGSCSRLDLISTAALLDALTHPKARGFASTCKPRGSCPSGLSLGQGEGQRCAAALRCPLALAEQHQPQERNWSIPAIAYGPGQGGRLQLFLVTSSAPSFGGKRHAHQFLWQ